MFVHLSLLEKGVSIQKNTWPILDLQDSTGGAGADSGSGTLENYPQRIKNRW